MAGKKKSINAGVIVAIIVAIVLGTNIFSRDQNHSGSAPITTEQSSHHQLQDQIVAGDKQQFEQNQSSSLLAGDAKIQQAFLDRRSDVQVEGVGVVKTVLADDQQGSRHQRFILELENGMTVLVAHNIDLSPRLEKLSKGDTVQFFGEYEYNTQGGVIHWTHHDPQGRHVDGWLKYKGNIYQ
ncbi:MAG: DUF3465 domain-containing protein [Acinetobacter populi]|jgi:molybdopterin converting factor small subunit|uniref:DUF3465 domain-containing protein n=1 Tax=Acinetobacter populi TaxID=1582270 RepID=UPI0023550FC0|nr:DUF3465 domain-containing protein [Acinetobacter populi]MCH4247365.1 DUF3465 domain-containing protein [Acinetobacter populi]